MLYFLRKNIDSNLKARPYFERETPNTSQELKNKIGVTFANGRDFCLFLDFFANLLLILDSLFFIRTPLSRLNRFLFYVSPS